VSRGLGVVALGALALVAGSACRTARYFPPVEAPAAGTSVEGMASWYGPKYHGRPTASGEIFDQNALTAAHPYWAFGTRVRVTLLSNGRSVVVKVNDRFGGHKGRIIDLSKGAAERIGLIGPGVGRVRLEIVG
jgi:peptidoglycan lytic transglycosylase